MAKAAKKPKAAKAGSSLYSPHPGVAMVQKWIAELPAKTGRSLDAWVALIQASRGLTAEVITAAAVSLTAAGAFVAVERSGLP